MNPKGLLVSVIATVLGITLAAVPVALWVAWTPLVFVGVLIVGAVSAALLILFLDHLHSAAGERADPSDARLGGAVPDEFVEEIHRIFPLTYHHGRIGRARFRRTMDKLRHLIR